MVDVDSRYSNQFGNEGINIIASNVHHGSSFVKPDNHYNIGGTAQEQPQQINNIGSTQIKNIGGFINGIPK